MPHREFNDRELRGLESFKRMARLLDLKRRSYFAKNCPKFAGRVSPGQFNHLMLLRFALPCNLSRVMAVTGLTSAGASLFVEKLVAAGVLRREIDPHDRRNVVISAAPGTLEVFRKVDQGLNELIDSYFTNCGCTPEELAVLERAGEIVCSKFDDPV
jgi:DNA-binding MarR family transcriptional regulator